MGEGQQVPESSSPLPWTREEDGYIIGICKEKEMRDWRNELRAAMPGRTWQEILKRMRYLGMILQKRRIVKSEGDDLGLRLRVYISRYMNLPEGSEDEIDWAEAIAHLQAYQRAAEGVTSGGPSCEAGVCAPVDFGVEAPRPVDGPTGGTYSSSSNQSSVLGSSDEATEASPPSEVKGAPAKFGGVKRWTADEDAAIRDGFEAGKGWREIAEGLPGRTMGATAERGHRLGLRRQEPWTADEDAAIRAGIEAGESWKTIADRLPGRNGDVVRHRARRLGLERTEKQVYIAWTEAEDAEIRAGVAAGETNAQIAERLPGRTVDAVTHRRVRMEDPPRVQERWTEAEDAALREGFGSGKSWKEIAEGLPGRTKSAVAARGRRTLKPKNDDSDSAA
jgi:hypothetical protein